MNIPIKSNPGSTPSYPAEQKPKKPAKTPEQEKVGKFQPSSHSSSGKQRTQRTPSQIDGQLSKGSRQFAEESIQRNRAQEQQEVGKKPGAAEKEIADEGNYNEEIRKGSKQKPGYKPNPNMGTIAEE